MYSKLLIGTMFVLGIPLLSLADGPDSGEIPPDYGPITSPPPPPAGQPASGWIFLSHPDHFRTPLYYLRDGLRGDPSVSILVTRKGSLSARRTFDLAPRLNLYIKESPMDQFVSVTSGDIVPVSGRLVKFERAEFPADYPRESIPKNVMHRGLRWTDITDSVPAELRPGKGWPLVLATSDPDKQSGHYRSYKLFPDRNIRRAEVNKQPFYVKVTDITANAKEGEQSRREIEIIARISPLQRKTVGKIVVRVGQSIQHNERAHRVLKIVNPQHIAGVGTLIGWVEVEL